MKIESGVEGRRARVDLVPLLDVLLMVLFFFLYLSLTLTSRQGIEVALAHATAKAVRPAATVVVTANDHIIVDGRTVSLPEAVHEVLSTVPQHRGGTVTVLLRSDRASRLGLSMELLSRLERAGLSHVSIEVDGR